MAKKRKMLIIIRQMQLKTTVSYHFTPSMMAIIRKTDGEDVEKLKPLCTQC